MTEFDSEACDVELAIAGVIVGVVLSAVEGGVGAEELSVDTGTTETPVFEVVGLTVGEVLGRVAGPVGDEVGETVVGPLLELESEVGPIGLAVELPLGAEEGTKDETLEAMFEALDAVDGSSVALDAADAVKDATVSVAEVP